MIEFTETVPTLYGDFTVWTNDLYVSKSIKKTGAYTDWECAFLAFNSVPGIFVDVGANIGWHSRSMCSRGYKSVALEPNALHFNLLSHNLHACDAELYNRGASNSCYSTTIESFDPSKPKNYGKLFTCGPGEQAHFITIDSLQLNNVTAVKIDVEGHELQVLEGMRRTLTQMPTLVIEYNYSAGDACISFLRDIGYKCEIYNDDFEGISNILAYGCF